MATKSPKAKPTKAAPPAVEKKIKRTKKTVEPVVEDVPPVIEEIVEEIVEAPVAPSKGLYLSNKELFLETKACKATGRMSNKLVKMLQLLCERLGRKGSFVDYSYNQDMQAYAMMMLVRTWQGFNPEKGTNAFAFYTQCIKNSFIQYLKHEKRQQIVRDKLMITSGLNPSYGYEDEGRHSGIEDERDFDHIRNTLESQTRETFVDAPIERDDKGDEIIEFKITEDMIDVDVDDDDEAAL